MHAALVLSTLLTLAQAPAAQAPRDWEATEARAYAYLGENKTAEAIALLERTVTAAPDFAQAHFVLAEMLVSAAGLPGSDGAQRTPEQRRLLERAVPHYTRAQALDPRLDEIVPLSLFRVYDEGGLDSPPDLERVARILVDRQPASAAWRASLAEALGRQTRWKEATDALLEAGRLVPADERVSFGMVMADFARERPSMPLAEARRLLGAADAIAGEAIAAAPNGRDGWMLRAGATGMLAERLAPGPERTTLEKTSSAAFDRFRELNPNRASNKAEVAFVDPPPSPPPSPPPPRITAPPGETTEDARRRLDEGLKAVRASASASPADDAAQASLAAYLWESARDGKRSEQARRAAVDEGLQATDVVLKRTPSHLEATVYRGLLLKLLAGLESSPARRDALLTEAAAMQERAQAITKRRVTPP